MLPFHGGQKQDVIFLTIKEIAQLAGVSVATVSRTINHQGKASPEVQKRVWDIMKKYDYVPNATGRSLRTTRTGMVLVLLPLLSNSFYSPIVEGIDHAARQQGYNIIVATIQMDRATEDRYLSLVRMRQVDGLISLSSTLSTAEIQAFGQQHPIVIACECPQDARISCVEIDNYKAGYDAATSLIRRGHKRIAMINFDYVSLSPPLREKGFRKALKDAGITPDESLILHTEQFDIESGAASCEKLLSLPEPPTAVFCYSDPLAIGMIHALAAHGLHAGKDMEIIGFDNTDVAGVFLPGITSVAQPTFDIGVTAFGLLHEKMLDLNSTPKRVTLPHTIVYRDTAKEPK